MTKWFIKNKIADVDRTALENNISKVLSKLLINRDVYNKTEIKEFLNPDIAMMHSPNLLSDLDISTSIIKDKIKNNLKIRIVGDFDVDGIMSVYILYKALKVVGANVDYVIPDRVLDGYGLNNHIVLNAKTQGVDTIITCDNGIAAFEPIKTAKNMDMTVIITDHHDITYIQNKSDFEYLMPDADAIINPKKDYCKYPFKNLCGAAIAYKLAQNILKEYRSKFNYKGLLEFVAIATVCDVVDLVGENRTIVAEGLKMLNRTQNIGLRALIEEMNLNDIEISTYHIGFIIGPVFNASGRLDSAMLGLSLLLEDNHNKVRQISEKLCSLNNERKKMTLDGVEKTDMFIKSNLFNDKVLVAFIPDLHESIAGIIAGRIKEKYNKPTIVLTRVLEGAKGSARSIEGYNIYEELTKCSDILIKYGGHPMAAGMSILEENIEELRKRLNNNSDLTLDDTVPKIYIDMAYPIQSINFDFITEISKLEPYGKGNPKPIFGDKSVKLEKATILGKNKNVLKLILFKDGGGKQEAIIFRDIEKWVSDIEETYGKNEKDNLFAGIDNKIKMDILYFPTINEFNGKKNIQITINDYRLLKY